MASTIIEPKPGVNMTLDWWIDITNHRLVGNPEHGGEWMAEVF